jgi:hypothetical protein
MMNAFQNFIDISKDTPLQSTLRLVDTSSLEATKRKLEELKKKNMMQQNAIRRRRYQPIVIEHDLTMTKLQNPELFSARVVPPSTEASELIRMAKILAYQTRQSNLNDDLEYESARKSFLNEYASKISQHNLYTKINGIFDLFFNPNYKETMFDSSYLQPGASNEYMKSVNNKIEAKKKAMEAIGATLTAPLPALSDYVMMPVIPGAVGKKGFGTKEFDELSIDGKINRLENYIYTIDINIDINEKYRAEMLDLIAKKEEDYKLSSERGVADAKLKDQIDVYTSTINNIDERIAINEKSKSDARDEITTLKQKKREAEADKRRAEKEESDRKKEEAKKRKDDEGFKAARATQIKNMKDDINRLNDELENSVGRVKSLGMELGTIEDELKTSSPGKKKQNKEKDLGRIRGEKSALIEQIKKNALQYNSILQRLSDYKEDISSYENPLWNASIKTIMPTFEVYKKGGGVPGFTGEVLSVTGAGAGAGAGAGSGSSSDGSTIVDLGFTPLAGVVIPPGTRPSVSDTFRDGR